LRKLNVWQKRKKNCNLRGGNVRYLQDRNGIELKMVNLMLVLAIDVSGRMLAV
jgi:hypothetical protein